MYGNYGNNKRKIRKECIIFVKNNMQKLIYFFPSPASPFQGRSDYPFC